jgi:hypothetical protein
LLGEARSMIQYSLAGIYHCLRVATLFVRWKIHCRYMFENEVSLVSFFYGIWREEVPMQLLAKCALLVKDAK